MALAKQPSAMPTNKLSVAVMVGPAATEAWGAVMASVYPALSGPEMSMLIGGLAALVVGWLVPDRAQA